MKHSTAKSVKTHALPKTPTGVTGFDEITGGGLPKGRPTLVCGGPGCGKTLFALEFVIRGALEFDEPGVIITFEENGADLARNVASMGLDLAALVTRKKIAIDYIRIERAEIEETGEYNLEGLFVRIKAAVDSIGAKRVALDTVETLFAGLADQGVLRSELRRLFGWFKEQGLTVVVTGEQGSKGMLTRQGLEEYISDCVILLDQRVRDQITTRRMRIVKYRGTTHGANEYPFVIDSEGISVFPITSLNLDFEVSSKRLSTGISTLDGMLGGGYYEGSTILLTGSAGTGKTSLASLLAKSVCASGRRCLYFSFEEAPQQLFRNMRSIGLDLAPLVASGRLRVESARPTLLGLEQHIVRLRKNIEKFQPAAVVLDPVTSLLGMGEKNEIEIALTRIIDFLKGSGVTAFLNALTEQGGRLDTSIGFSSLIDTWLLLRDFETANERNRGLYIIKSRGMAHSNQVREFRITDAGVDLQEPYLGPAGVLMGSSRIAQEMQDEAEQRIRTVESVRRRDLIAAKRRALESEIESLRLTFKTEVGAIETKMEAETRRDSASTAERAAVGKSRWDKGRHEGPRRKHGKRERPVGS